MGRHSPGQRLFDGAAPGGGDDIARHRGAVRRGPVRHGDAAPEPRLRADVGRPGGMGTAGVVVATLPGATLWHEGQLDGRRVRVPVFLVRRPEEPTDATLRSFYERLLAVDVRAGRWELCSCDGWPDNHSAQRLLAWSWT